MMPATGPIPTPRPLPATYAELRALHPTHLCPISGTLLREPVLAPSGETFEHDAIVEWVRCHGRLPTDGSDVAPAWPWPVNAAIYRQLHGLTFMRALPPPPSAPGACTFGSPRPASWAATPPCMPPCLPSSSVPAPHATSHPPEAAPAVDARPAPVKRADLDAEAPHKWLLSVKTLTGKTLCVVVSPRGTIADLREAINDLDGIPTDQQRLVYAGKQLDPKHEGTLTFADYGLVDGATVHLVLQLSGD